LHFTEPLTVLDKKIIEAFMVFDHTSSNTVDVREVGTIIRSLGKLILLVEIFRNTKYLHINGSGSQLLDPHHGSKKQIPEGSMQDLRWTK
jgi:hypothetical protein